MWIKFVLHGVKHLPFKTVHKFVPPPIPSSSDMSKHFASAHISVFRSNKLVYITETCFIL